MVRLAAALATVAIALLASPAAALAGTLDQQQTSTSGGTGAINSGNSLAQTFTAGLSGGVDQVDLRLDSLGTQTAPLIVQIRGVSGSAPGSTVLASQSVPASGVPAVAAFVSVNFGTSAPVVAGSQYAIVAYSSTTGAYRWYYGAPNPYADGGGFYAINSPPSGTWFALSADLVFKTYVAPPMATPAAATGQRAAALKKCKKKFPGKAKAKKRKKCKKKAKLLPV